MFLLCFTCFARFYLRSSRFQISEAKIFSCLPFQDLGKLSWNDLKTGNTGRMFSSVLLRWSHKISWRYSQKTKLRLHFTKHETRIILWFLLHQNLWVDGTKNCLRPGLAWAKMATGQLQTQKVTYYIKAPDVSSRDSSYHDKFVLSPVGVEANTVNSPCTKTAELPCAMVSACHVLGVPLPHSK